MERQREKGRIKKWKHHSFARFKMVTKIAVSSLSSLSIFCRASSSGDGIGGQNCSGTFLKEKVRFTKEQAGRVASAALALDYSVAG